MESLQNSTLMTEVSMRGWEERQLTEYINETQEQQNFEDIYIPRDGYSIPIEDILDLLKQFPYGNQFRVMTLFLVITGARMSELDNMHVSGLMGSWLYWKTGKNQTTSRCEYIPDYLYSEWKYYKTLYRTVENKLFGISSQTYKRLFAKYRQTMPENWKKKCLLPITERKTGFNNLQMREEYRYQIKGFRKTFATFTFMKLWIKYNSAEVAAIMTAKKMRHSTQKITCKHYVEQCKFYDKYKDRELYELFKVEEQRRLKV